MYYLMYDSKNFSETLISNTKQLGLNPSKESIIEYLKFIVEHYKIKEPIPKISFEDKESLLGRGCYIRKSNEIIFYGKTELITVLHEIRHFVQFNTILQSVFKNYNEREEDARGWSSSLFYTIYPTEYLNLSNQGKIKFI